MGGAILVVLNGAGLAAEPSEPPVGPDGVPDLSSVLADLVFYAHANAPENTEVQVSETFDPADVDTGADTIAVTVPLDDITMSTSSAAYQVVFFSTTGTLPAPLILGKPYCAECTGGVTTVYPIARTTDWFNVLGGTYGDYIAPFQLAAQNRGKVDLTSQGSGVHTIYTRPLMDVWKDLTGNDYDFSNGTGNYNELYEILDEGANGKYIHSYGPMIRQYNLPSIHNLYAKIQANDGGAAFRGEYSLKNLSGGVAIIRPVRMSPSDGTKQHRITDASINTGTGVITFGSAHGITNGEPITWTAPATETMPTPSAGLITDTFYGRSVTSTTGTLHPSAADAIADTNVITYSSAGSGSFMLTFIKRCAPADGPSYVYDFCKPDETNAHSSNLGFVNPFVGTSTAMTKSSWASTAPNGRLTTNGGGITSELRLKYLKPCICFSPPGVNMPITSDRGVALNVKSFITGITLGANHGFGMRWRCKRACNGGHHLDRFNRGDG